jgi:hypothetical protein
MVRVFPLHKKLLLNLSILTKPYFGTLKTVKQYFFVQGGNYALSKAVVWLKPVKQYFKRHLLLSNYMNTKLDISNLYF